MMMKKNVLIGLLSVLSFTACYEDLGNYDYTDPLEITISGIDSTYAKLALTDSVVVSPQVSPDNREWDCFWGIYRTQNQGVAATFDTIAKTRELNWQVAVEPGTYNLVFCARDRNTGIAEFHTSLLRVETTTTTGWYLLTENAGVTDLDVFTEFGKVENLIATMNDGYTLEGTAQMIEYQNMYKAWNENTGMIESTPCFFVLSGEDMVVMRVRDGKIVNYFEDCFYSVPDVRKPQIVFQSNSGLHLVNDGKLYSIYTSGKNSGKFGEAKSGDYQVTSWRVTYGSNGALLYDSKGGAFATVSPNNVTLTYLSEAPNNPPVTGLESELLFMGASNMGNGYGAYSLLRRNTLAEGEGEDRRYVLRKSSAKVTSATGYVTSFCDTLSADLKFAQAEVRAGNLDYDIIYFAIDNQLYSYNTQTGVKTPQGSPLEGKVTFMQHLKYTYPTVAAAERFDCLVVGIEVGERYKVYRYNFQGGNLLLSDKEVFEGVGKVKKATYITPQLYTILY